MKRQAVIVLGMHRSGTSALTRVVNLLGADLPKNLMPPLPEVNERGFWESVELCNINSKLLEITGGSWRDVSPLESSSSSSGTISLEEEALEVLEDNFEHSSLFVLKDPRMCRLMYFWMPIFKTFGAQPAFAFILRNPREIAASLKVRDGMLPGRAHLLWLRHLLEAERDTRGYKRSFITYEQLMGDWQRTVERMANELGITWPRLGHKTRAEIELFLSEDLRHHCFDDDDLAYVAPLVKRAYFAAKREAEQAGTNSIEDVFDAIRTELDTGDAIFGPLLAEETQQKRQLEQERVLLREKLAMNQDILVSWEEKEKLERELAMTLQKVDTLADNLQEREKQASLLEAQLKEAEDRKDELVEQIKIKNGEIERELQVSRQNVLSLNSKVKGMQEREDALIRRLAAQDMEIERANRELDALDRRVGTLMSLLDKSYVDSGVLLRNLLGAAHFEE